MFADKGLWIREKIKSFVNDSPDNTLSAIDEKAWGEPLVGFSNGADGLFKYIKEDIGEFYWLPEEIYKLTYPEENVKADELTIISWILPQTEQTKLMHKKEANYPSNRWVLSRTFGDDFNKKVAGFVIDLLAESGIKAFSPGLSSLWGNRKSEKYGYASNWSERHTAYISGLGTFGLCDGLITPVGKAMRCGSIVARISIEPTKRPYSKLNEYCLYYSKGTCMACAKRCPSKSISEHGHDKMKCQTYKREKSKNYIAQEYGIESACCGLCQTGVPCESGIPRGIIV